MRSWKGAGTDARGPGLCPLSYFKFPFETQKSQKSCQMAAVHLVEMRIPDFMLIWFQVPLNLQFHEAVLEMAICFR